MVLREGFFGPLLAEPIERSGVVRCAAKFHELASAARLALVFTRFTVPEAEGGLVRNTEFMRVVADAQEHFRSDSPGVQLIPEIAVMHGHIVDWAGRQRASRVAGAARR